MTTTNNKSLNEPALNDLNWNTPLNANFDIIDNALGSFVSIATTSGNYALLTTDLQNMCWKSNTSAFTGNVTYTIPSGVKGQWVVINQSGTSSYTLSVVCGSTSIVVERGKTRSIYCDGTSVFYADSPGSAGADTQVIYNSAGNLTGSNNLTFNGAAISLGGSTATTNATCSSTTATVTFSNGETIPVGSIVTITGVTPTGYNGSWVTTGTATLNQVQFTVLSTLGNQTVAGLLSYGNLSLGGSLIGGIAPQQTAIDGTNNSAVMTPLSTSQAITGQVGVANAAPVKTALNASGSAPIYGCRAWVNFDGVSGTINASGNISSLVRNSAGNYTVTFTTAMVDENYAISITPGISGTGTAVLQVSGVSKLANSITFLLRNQNGSQSGADNIGLAIFR